MANKISCGGFSIDGETIVEENGILKAIDNSTTVIANPTLAGTEDALTGLQVGDTKYSIGDGSSLEIIHATASSPVVNENTTTYTLTIQETGTKILGMDIPIILATIQSPVAGRYQLLNGIKLLMDDVGTTFNWSLNLSGTEAICEITIDTSGEIQVAVLVVTKSSQ